MNLRPIVITRTDHDRLSALIESLSRSVPLREPLAKLAGEIGRARIVEPAEAPPDVVTLHCQVKYVDLDTGREETYQLVFPSEADIQQRKISVLAPVGCALLGFRTGDEIEWDVPAGRRRLRILDVKADPPAPDGGEPPATNLKVRA